MENASSFEFGLSTRTILTPLYKGIVEPEMSKLLWYKIIKVLYTPNLS